jgi:hypothetical protein
MLRITLSILDKILVSYLGANKKQTNKQTNKKQTNKQTNKKQTNKQTNKHK